MMRPLAYALFLAALIPFSAAHADAGPGSWLQSGRQWVKGLWQNEAEQWLDRINPALASHDYAGTLVFAQGADMQAFLVQNRVHDGQQSLRMQALSGPPRELVKQDGSIRSSASQPGGQVLSMASDQGAFSRFANALGNKYYRASLAGTTRVAGRPAQAIDLQAVDGLRYGYRLWLDQKTALPLRVLTIDGNGAVIEQMAFTQIRITPAADIAGTERRTKPKSPDSPFGEIDGFRLQAVQTAGTSRHYLYSDGLASFSLYVEPSTVKEKGRMHQAAVNGLMYGDGRMRYVAMGKVPLTTLQQALAMAAQTP